jgi:creatinine amidohydrolase
MNATLPGPAANTEAIRLALQSWPDVEAYLKGCKGIIIPLGSTEQHGPTGAIGTDALTAEAVALELGRRSGVLVTPAQAYGMAEHHLGFAGTMSLQPATLMAVMHDLVLSLATHGFERIFVVNGHGGKQPLPRPMERPPAEGFRWHQNCAADSPTGSWLGL